MAYYLAAGDSASGDYVSIPDTNLTGDFTVEFEMAFNGSQNWRPFGRIGDFNSRAFKSGGTNNFQVGSTSLQVIVISGVTYTDRNTYTLIRSGSTLSLEVNGVAQGSVNDSGAFNFNAILTQNSFAQSRGASDLYRFRIWSDATKTSLVRDYNPSLSNGTGSILPDAVGGNDGALVNFPTDDSQWIFYSDATGATADAAFTINAPTFAVSADAALPQPIANTAFTINAPTFSASASVTTPGFNASVNFAIPAPTFSVDAAVTLPSPTVDVNYTVSAPTFNVSANASLPQPLSDVSFAVGSPLFAATATATEPSFNADVSFNVGAPTFSGNASATLPQPVADANFTVSAPTFSVVAIVGGIAIIVDEETNINQRVLSNNINAPILSTNING